MNTAIISTIDQLFPDLLTAKKAIAAYVIDGESYKVHQLQSKYKSSLHLSNLDRDLKA